MVVLEMCSNFFLFCLKEEEKKVTEELEALKLKFQEKEKINEQLVQNLDAALSEIENLKVSLLDIKLVNCNVRI